MLNLRNGLLVIAAMLSSVSALAANSSIHGISEDAPIASKYMLYCGGCHGLDGKGEVDADVPMLPPKVGAFLNDDEGPWYLVNVGGVMSAGISDTDAAAIMNYVMLQFGGDTMPDPNYRFTAEQIAKLRATPPNDLVALRKRIEKRLAQQDISLPDDYPWN